jgi:hypothetical protein
MMCFVLGLTAGAACFVLGWITGAASKMREIMAFLHLDTHTYHKVGGKEFYVISVAGYERATKCQTEAVILRGETASLKIAVEKFRAKAETAEDELEKANETISKLRAYLG